jgi:UDP-N-acetylmuramoyl-L-alanyl-D-glutamate--2,6-diaminopimelate ligase
MERYFQAKRSLFDHHLTEHGRRVLPVDDPWGSRLLDDPREGDLSWGLASGHVHARHVEADLDGARFELCLPVGVVPARLRLLGLHNVRNAIAAAAAGHAAGLSASAICRGLEEAEPLAGRLERVAVELPYPVLVDFAHSPDGLRSVLEALRQISDRRLIVVFGAGGDRDTGKRVPMGAAVGEHADVAIVTSDNPRSEDPSVIAAAVADGVRSAGGEPMVVLDRREAIRHALDIADEGALVLVAGKGHESTQTIGDRRIPFSDQQVIRELAGGGS